MTLEGEARGRSPMCGAPDTDVLVILKNVYLANEKG